MKQKKFLASLLAFSLTAVQLTSALAVQPISVQSFAAEITETFSNTNGYFYQQLSDESKIFYDAMYTMYQQGIFKTGKENFDLVASGLLSQEQAAEYADGGPGVLNIFGAARDAFYMDFADIFYVDFAALSIRVTNGKDGYHVYLGTGRKDNYYAEGFSSVEDVEQATAEFQAVVDKVAEEASNLTVEEGKNLTVEQVRYVHNYVTQHVSYRLEDACQPENIGLIRNAYGPLVKGEGVCEGYSRAFKAILDKLNIPCVLVSGVYKETENQPELHMWTFVQIDEKWYGVDPTMDDPITTNASDGGIDGAENESLFLIGEDILNRHHLPSAFLSEANYPFHYPEPENDSYGVETVTNQGGLVVQYKADSEMEGIPAGDFLVSYNGMGYAKTREQGKYIIVRFINYYEENDETVDSGWCYIEPQYYPDMKDTDTELTLTLASAQDVQFAITDIPPKTNEYGYPDLVFDEEPIMLEQSSIIHNENGYYMPAPYARWLTPRNSGSLIIEHGKQHVSATFDEVLTPIDGETFDVVMECDTPSGKQASVLENVEWDGKSTISFDFTPSKMWADDRATYTFSIKGLKSARSGKRPLDISYMAKFQSYVCAYRSQGINWNVFAQPQLLDNSDISMNDWKTSTGEPVNEKLRDRMVLVASSPSHQEEDNMNELVDTQTNDKVLESKSFEINLSICKAQVASTGDGVRVMLGFPEGYGPEDAGVTFKVYHFMKDADGNFTGVEEIPCVITEYGLVVTCMSFSPYMIAAVEDDGTEPETKSVVAVTSEGGTVSGTEIVTLSEGEETTFNIQADAGYVIDAISVGGKLVETNHSSAMDLTVNYADIADSSCIIDVKFAAESVIEQEEAKGETAVQVDAEAEAAPAGNLSVAPEQTTPEETTTETTTSEPETTTTETTTTETTTTKFETETATLPETTSTSNIPETTTTSESKIETTSEPETTTTSESKTETTTTSTSETTTTSEPETTTLPETTTSITVQTGDKNTATKILVSRADEQTDLYLLYPVDSLNYRQAGFSISIDGKEKQWSTDTVYQSVMIQGKEYTAKEFGGKYLVALEITDVPADSAETASAVPVLNATETITAELPKKAYTLPDMQKEEIV